MKSNTPNLGLPAEEEYLALKSIEEDTDYEVAEPEDVEEVCPECGSNKMMRYPQADGPDDFTWVYECKSCGATQS